MVAASLDWPMTIHETWCRCYDDHVSCVKGTRDIHDNDESDVVSRATLDLDDQMAKRWWDASPRVVDSGQGCFVLGAKPVSLLRNVPSSLASTTRLHQRVELNDAWSIWRRT